MAQVCSALRIDYCTQPYLQRYLKARLRPTDPALAERVGALGCGDMDELCRRVRALQREKERV